MVNGTDGAEKTFQEVLTNAEQVPNFETLMTGENERATFNNPRIESFTLKDPTTPEWVKYVAAVVGGGDETHVLSVPIDVHLPPYMDVFQAREICMYRDGRFLSSSTYKHLWGEDDLSVANESDVSELPARFLYVFEDLGDE